MIYCGRYTDAEEGCAVLLPGTDRLYLQARQPGALATQMLQGSCSLRRPLLPRGLQNVGICSQWWIASPSCRPPLRACFWRVLLPPPPSSLVELEYCCSESAC